MTNVDVFNYILTTVRNNENDKWNNIICDIDEEVLDVITIANTEFTFLPVLLLKKDGYVIDCCMSYNNNPLEDGEEGECFHCATLKSNGKDIDTAKALGELMALLVHYSATFKENVKIKKGA